MITVDEIDRLVVGNDAVAARLWPRLGPRVRQAYLADRDRWTELRRKPAGGAIPPSTLAAQNKVFGGWARGFQAVAGRRAKAGTSKAASTKSPTFPTQPPTMLVPSAKPTSKGGGALIAGGILLVGALAFAAGRRRA